MIVQSVSRIALGACMLVGLVSCQQGAAPPAANQSPAAQTAAPVDDGPHTSAITGTIKYDGPVPEFLKTPIDTGADATCQMHRTTPLYREDLVLGDGQTLANVIVHIVGGLPKREYPVPTTAVELTQQGCQYAPHVFGIRAGQPLKVLNPDTALHNVKTMSKINPPFNMSMISSVKEKTVVFNKPEFVIPIQCDVHPWMNAYCAVMDNPFFAVSGKDGKFTIPDLGPGTYEVEAWHERLGVQKMTVQVGKDEKKTIDFTFTKPSK